jgi:hypothetical protein
MVGMMVALQLVQVTCDEYACQCGECETAPPTVRTHASDSVLGSAKVVLALTESDASVIDSEADTIPEFIAFKSIASGGK